MASKPMKLHTSARSSSPSRPRRLRDFLRQKYERIPKTRRHAMLAATCLLWFAVVGVVAGVASLRHSPGGPGSNTSTTTTSPSWVGPAGNTSHHMALSIMSRKQGIMTPASPSDPGAALEAGIVQKALAAYTSYHGTDPEIQAYIDLSTVSAARLMADEAADLARWPLDRLAVGNAMLADTTGDQAVADALPALRKTVHHNNVNPDDGDGGGMWYWQEYPGWAYLDGAYGLAPFVAADYARGMAGDDTVTTSSTGGQGHKAAHTLAQLDLLWAHTRDAATGLLVHGYYYHHEDGITGPEASGVVWARGVALFLMALVDTLELVWPKWRGGGLEWGRPPPEVMLLRRMSGMYASLAMDVLRYVDDESRGWFQVVDAAGREGNYVESSATAMFAYALLKGARLGYLGPDPENAVLAVEAGYAAHKMLVERFVSGSGEGEGLLDWAGTVGVCSLNSTADYEYYVSRPLVPNSALGAAAFVLASVEVERLGGDAAVGVKLR
ncbi:hypothetical protein KVR01_010307 [Diaporthe batatas]|uniref:uncharacterized protein n=1 Tax=Diaporthe batatas TaxID=748121 RepID=UPI001D05BF19|nr:uncharacterized protein KVR01_010307 [Diaporthe batatas]KAG8159670.1 hypothetical protein KVR01_010307 [Diaporthe batatas]